MKIKLFLFTILTLGIEAKSQQYQFTLIQNSVYNYTLAVVTNVKTSKKVGNPKLDQYGGSILLPNNAFIDEKTIIFHYGNEKGLIESISLDEAMKDSHVTLLSIASGIHKFPAHRKGEIIPLITFDVLGAPKDGSILLLNNNHPLALQANYAFDSFFVIDVQGGEKPINAYLGQIAKTEYSFNKGAAEDLISSKDLILYPNPTSAVVQFKGSVDRLFKIELYSIKGQKLLTIGEELTQLDISAFEKGVYFIRFYFDGNNEVMKKLIKL